METKNINGNQTPNGWTEWGKYVLKTLESITNRLDDLQKELQENRLELNDYGHKVKEEIKKEVEGFYKNCDLKCGGLSKDILSITSTVTEKIAGDIEKSNMVFEEKINITSKKIDKFIAETNTLDDKVAAVDKEVTILKVKAGFIGGIAALITSALVSIVLMLLKGYFFGG